MNMIKWVLTNSSKYSQLLEKQENTVYFLQDTHQIYRGSTCYSQSIIISEGMPENPESNVLYYDKVTKCLHFYDGENWIRTTPEVCTNDLSGDEPVNDDAVPTVGTVKEYVTTQVENIIQEVANSTMATQITLGQDLEVKGVTIGSYTDGDVISADTTLYDILKRILQKRMPATYSQPSIALNLASKLVETGTKITGTAITTFNQRDAGPINQYTLSMSDGSNTTILLEQDTIVPYELADSDAAVGETPLTLMSSVKYDEGPIKTDSLGDPSPEGHILAGSKSTSIKYTSYRKGFFGHEPGPKDPCTTSDEIRALPESTIKAVPTGEVAFTINCTKGDTRLTIAYPATLGDITFVKSIGLGGMNVINAFDISIISVEGADGYEPIDYKVYTYIPDVPYPADDTYEVTI